MPSKRKLIHEIESNAAHLSQVLAETRFWHELCLARAEEEHQQAIADIEARHRDALAKAASAYEAVTAEAVEGIRAINQSAGLLATPWEDASWEGWKPVMENETPPFLRIGQLVEADQWSRLALPALLPLVGGQNVLLKASGEAKAGQTVIMNLNLNGETRAAKALSPAAEAISSSPITIPNESGLHARPAAVLAGLARKFDAAIRLCRGDEAVNAKSLVSIMTLDVAFDDIITLEAAGPDAQEALNTLVPAVEKGLADITFTCPNCDTKGAVDANHLNIDMQSPPIYPN